MVQKVHVNITRTHPKQRQDQIPMIAMTNSKQLLTVATQKEWMVIQPHQKSDKQKTPQTSKSKMSGSKLKSNSTFWGIWSNRRVT